MALERWPPFSPRTVTKCLDRTSPTVGLALQVSISWRAEMSETDAAASLPTLPIGEAAIQEGQPRSSRSSALEDAGFQAAYS